MGHPAFGLSGGDGRGGQIRVVEYDMPDRSFWKGYLKLSLVTCPVAMTPAVSDGEKVRFHTLNRQTGHRVVSQYVDAVSGKPVEEGDEVKGYARGEDEFVMLEEDDLEAVALESTRTIDIEMFAPQSSIGWIWYDRPHYLTPRDNVGEEAFLVIRDAMASTKTVGISRLVLYRRERAVMLVPRDKGIVLWTLRYGDEVRDENAYFNDIPTSQLDTDLVKLVKQLIDERTRSWDPTIVNDPVQERLLEIIAAKKKSKPPPKKSRVELEQPPNVVNIMDALRKSIASQTPSRKHR